MTNIHWETRPVWNFDVASDYTADAWTGDTSLSAAPAMPQFAATGDFGMIAADQAPTKGANLISLTSFKGSDGEHPDAGLFADAAGDLFGTTIEGGADDDGTVFEVAKTESGYARTPITLVSFTSADGSFPCGALIADAAGDLFGTTQAGGVNDRGTVFEIVKTKGGYAAAPTTLVSFTSIPGGSIPFGALLADAAGNLFGTTSQGGRDNDGTVFEISKTKHGYASTPTTLVSFKGADGANPFGSLIADAKGDLIGTTAGNEQGSPGTVFEIAKTRGGYASAPTVLASFTGPMGSNPSGNLIADAAGDLFGTTETGAYGYGTVFEIVKTNSGYAAPTSLVYFTAKDGDQPAGLTIDASGNLFGVAHFGGPDNDGNVFEIAKVNGGYAGVTKIVNFTGLNGTDPNASLIADAAGDLFDTTYGGGADSDGKVIEITNSGFVPPAAPAMSTIVYTAHLAPRISAFLQAMAGTPGHGEMAELFSDRTIRDRHQSMLAMPRLVVA